MKGKGILFILSAASGTGKTTLIKKLIREFPHIKLSVSVTTRPPRPGEKEGVDYFFVDDEAFHRKVEQKEFIEWATVHGHRYGTLRRIIEENKAKGIDTLLEIDVQGARQLKENLKEGVYIFVLPPSIQELERRIHDRGADSPEVVRTRLHNAQEEINQFVWYDYIVVNDRLDDAYDRLRAIVLSEKCRRDRMLDAIKDFLRPESKAATP